mmetsp:Transcript_15139/g.40370  ORF Transcript_15139/g.40370 Transcript_15139/m.40370 type:complete len:95 (+) Transcript_15139:118-402(+)
MCKLPMGWCNKPRSNRINIWALQRKRPAIYLTLMPFHETKFTRPPWLTKYGFPANPRTDPKEIGRKGEAKYCDMSRLHRQDAARPLELREDLQR